MKDAKKDRSVNLLKERQRWFFKEVSKHIAALQNSISRTIRDFNLLIAEQRFPSWHSVSLRSTGTEPPSISRLDPK